jgi:hypothetical protein
MPGKFPKEYLLHSEHGKSLKTSVVCCRVATSRTIVSIPEAGNDGLLERPHLLVVEVNVI